MTRDQIYEDVRKTFGLVPEFIQYLPDNTLEHDWAVIKMYGFEETAIPPKYRGLMGVLAASVLHDPYCADFFTKYALSAGATQEELKETARIGMLVASLGTLFQASGQTPEEYRQEFTKVWEYLRQQGQQKAA